MEDGLVGDFIKIVIRTDSSDWIGTGHVNRCLTLSDELVKKGADNLILGSSGLFNKQFSISKNFERIVEAIDKVR